MILEKQIIHYALFVSAFFLSHNYVAQEDVLKLLPGSKKANYFEENDLLKLEGDVNFEYQQNTMFVIALIILKKHKLFVLMEMSIL